MDGLALIEAFGDFKEEKSISKIDLMAIIEDALKTLLRKRFDSDDHFDVIVNPDKGDFQIFLNKVIVEDDMSEDDDLEIEISEAKKIDPTFEVGEDYTVEIPIEQLGRRSILTLKQIISRDKNSQKMVENSFILTDDPKFSISSFDGIIFCDYFMSRNSVVSC
jgi:N utilization substance protein A